MTWGWEAERTRAHMVTMLHVNAWAVVGISLILGVANGSAQTLPNDFSIFSTPYFENTAKVIPASASCPNGKIAVIAGQNGDWDTGVALARPLFDAAGAVDTTSPTQDPIPLTRGGSTRAIATDNQIVRQKDGSLLAIRNSTIWDEFTINPPLWANELIKGIPKTDQKGQRGSIHVYRSTNCGATWILYSLIDFGTFLNGKYGNPRPMDDAGNADINLSTTSQGHHPDGSLKWYVGGGDRTELYACPFTGYVFLATGVVSGPYNLGLLRVPFRVTTLLLYSKDFGRTWEPINEDFGQAWEPLVMTTTPNGRLFLFQSIGSEPTIYYSLDSVTSQDPPRISPPYTVKYVENGREIPNTTVIPPSRPREIVNLFLQAFHPSISRISTDTASSRVRAAYHSLNSSGMQETRVVLIDVQHPDRAPDVTPVKTISAENARDYSVLYFNFIDPDYIDMPAEARSNTSVGYWIEVPRIGITAKQYAIRYMVFEGDYGTSCPAYLSMSDNRPRTWSARQDLGDYMTGGFFWKNNTLNYLGQWVDPTGIRANVISLPYVRTEPLLTATGKLSLLQVHDVNACFGTASDSPDVEVLTALNSQPGKVFGFQLRADESEGEHRKMLDLLRSAFRGNRTVRIDYHRRLPHSTLIRVEKLD